MYTVYILIYIKILMLCSVLYQWSMILPPVSGADAGQSCGWGTDSPRSASRQRHTHRHLLTEQARGYTPSISLQLVVSIIPIF